MKTISFVTIGIGLLASPIILLQTMIVPQLDELREFYANMDVTTQKVLDDATTSTTLQQ